MFSRIPTNALAYAIAQERARWFPNSSSEAERRGASEALDYLARDLASRLHPDKQPEFLARSGTTEK